MLVPAPGELANWSGDWKNLKYLDPESDIWEQTQLNYTEPDPVKFTLTSRKLDTRDPEVRLSIRSQILDTVGQLFKIHLQPKPQYQYAVMARIFSVAAQNKSFSRQIGTIKTVFSYDAVYNDRRRIPAIVIYPVYGTDIANFILDVLVALFDRDARKVGLDLTPRYNKKINDLIYVAGFHGDAKKYLQEQNPELLEKIFEENLVFLRCPREKKCRLR